MNQPLKQGLFFILAAVFIWASYGNAGQDIYWGMGYQSRDGRSPAILIDGPFVRQGDCSIRDSADIESLKGITRIAGSLLVCDSNLTDLKGLESLECIDGDLWIENNSYLTSLEGLDSLTVVKHLYIFDNAILPDLSGLDELKTVSGVVSIENNASLVSLSGLDSLVSAGYLGVVRNNTLNSLFMDSLCHVSDLFLIRANANLCTPLAHDLKDQVLNCPGGGIDGGILIDGNLECGD